MAGVALGPTVAANLISGLDTMGAHSDDFDPVVEGSDRKAVPLE
jgi:hypothetical protein